MADWTNLSQDLLGMISDFSISPDHFRMQSVCKSWWSILKNSNIRELPSLMMLPKDKEEDPDAFDFFSLSKQKISTIPLPEMRGKRCCGSFQNGWLMTVDIDLNVCLFHPWSKKKLDLPHQSTFKKQCFSVGTYTIEEIRDMHILKAALSMMIDTCVDNYFCSPHGCCDNGVFNVEDNTVVEQLFADRFHPTSAPPLWIATPPYSF